MSISGKYSICLFEHVLGFRRGLTREPLGHRLNHSTSQHLTTPISHPTLHAPSPCFCSRFAYRRRAAMDHGANAEDAGLPHSPEPDALFSGKLPFAAHVRWYQARNVFLDLEAHTLG